MTNFRCFAQGTAGEKKFEISIILMHFQGQFFFFLAPQEGEFPPPHYATDRAPPPSSDKTGY